MSAPKRDLKQRAEQLKAEMAAAGERAEARERTAAMYAEAAEAACRDWYGRAIREPYAKFFLFWRRPLSGERMALPVIDTKAPNENWRQSILVSTSWSVPQAKVRVLEAMRNLPLLG